MKNAKAMWERLRNWELWPFNLIFAPLGPLWLYYAARAKSFWWFTPANPTLTFAGFEGEGKREMYELLPPDLYPTTVYVRAGQDFGELAQALAAAGLQYPLCAKPEVGLKGLLFRKLDDEAKLRYYHSQMPVDYLIQPLVDGPLEVSVFYYRHPAKPSGVVSGFIQKEMMQVAGDGETTLWDLIRQHPKAKHRLEEMRIKHRDFLQTVMPAGQTYTLAHAANLNRGARFINLENEIDERLLIVFDPLSHRCGWYYGRYDIKCESVEELKKGRFTILEFNGAGAEPNHVYNAGYPWHKALGVFARHWKVLFEIGRYNHRHNGVRYWGNREGLRWIKKARRHADLLEACDRKILV